MNDLPDGVILAAGYSSRMTSFKPLCPIGAEKLIERAVRILRAGGIRRIYTVTGHRAEELEGILRERDVTPLYNENFDRGMYSSVRRAVRGLPADSPGFLMLPVDYPFVLPETVKLQIDAFRDSGADVVFPVCSGRKGHPPVISSALYGDIVKGNGDGGLRALLNDPRYRCELAETGDEGILFDTDTDEALEDLLRRFKDRVQ